MADVRVPKKKAPAKKKAKPPVALYTLTADELLEYQNRHRLLIMKQMEFQAASHYMDIFQNMLIEEHALPIKFNLNMETGMITEVEVEENAKMVVYELFEVEAASPEAAVATVQKRSKKDSVIVAAESLGQLAHPVHLAEAQEKFASPVVVDLADNETSDK